MVHFLLGIYTLKRYASHIGDLLAGKTIAQEVVHIEVVQLVWSHFVFGLLCDIAIFIGRQQLRRNRSIYDIQEYLACVVAEDILCRVLYEVTHQGLRYACVESVHRHLIAAVGCPTESQFAHVACTYYKTVILIGHIHQHERAYARLRILVGYIMQVDVVTYIL